MAFIRQLALCTGLAGAGALAYACSSKGTTNPNPPHTFTITRFSADSLVGDAGTTLGSVLVVYVKDERDSSVAGATVTWTATTGGGSVSSATSQTDLDGHASIQRTLGPAAGYQATTASLSGATGSPVTFTTISELGSAFSVARFGADSLSDTVLSTTPLAFMVQVLSYNGTPVSNFIVNYTVTQGGGAFPKAADTTDISGLGRAGFIMPAATGPITVQASVPGLVGSPVTFHAIATPGNAAQLVKSTGDSQAALISTALAAPHTVMVKDAHGNPVPGVAIQWAVGTGGGSVSSAGPISDGTGLVSITRTLGGSLGAQADTAIASLSGSPIVFTSFGDSVAHTAAVTVGPGIAYSPNSSTVGSIGKGGKVTWTFNGGTHSVQWQSGPVTPASSNIMGSGTYSVTFTTPGTYTYDCAVHGAAMTGTVIVRP
ncbi:MAG TPA: plastocyanin/azurin family copper-binding protein [Gemmatimonadales bacterium]|nr:plastocyanin/azurin family copper-binding protein [Gemmatimonadales bacterium]